MASELLINSNGNASMASSAYEQHSINQRLAAVAAANAPDTQMSIPDDVDGDDEFRTKDHKLTRQNLKSIPDADQLAPGIRLPAERLTGDLNGNGNEGRGDEDDNDQEHGIERDERHQEGELATVPPELDPRTAVFRPPSPSSASVLSVAVQAPGSPRPETGLGDSNPSPSVIRNAAPDSRPSSIRGSSPPLSASSEARSFSNIRSTPGGGLNSLNSGLARSLVSGSGSNQDHSNLITTSTGSQSFAEGPSLAPSEAGSSSSDSRSLANSNSRMTSRSNRDSINAEDQLMNDDDDERVEVGSSNSKNSSSRGEFDADEDSDEVRLRALYIERQRMHEREVMGGEAGVGGLSNLSSKGVLSYPFSASLRQEQEDSRNMNSGGGSGFRLPSRAGSTTATVGTSSPPASLSGVSDYDNDRARDDKDERLSLSGNRSTDTINSTGGTSFKAPSFVDSNGRRQSRSDAANSPIPMDESA